ncbi:hypothetical protein [Acidithiobacillus ferrivorans]|uniref:hypothetical protein n=1 Tax=Acidithiobacillus ferrivorans TaxID=160808 RepID=UPI00159EC6B2|nr:hypothetical protein [Acidithiobacillus ferrivorans]
MARWRSPMIMRFADKQTVAVFADLQICRFGAEVLRVAQRKLAQLHRAERIKDLAVPPRQTQTDPQAGDRHGLCPRQPAL